MNIDDWIVSNEVMYGSGEMGFERSAHTIRGRDETISFMITFFLFYIKPPL